MKYLDIHNLVLAILGLFTFGFGLHFKIGDAGIIGVFVVLLFPLLTRYVFVAAKDWRSFALNVLLLAVLCGTTWWILHSFTRHRAAVFRSRSVDSSCLSGEKS